MGRIKKITDLLIQINIWTIIFVTPLLFAPPFFATNNVFELPKFVLFKILVILLLFLSILKYLFLNKNNLFKFLKDFFVNNKIFFLIIAFCLFSIFVSTIFSDFFRKSFFGSYERELGLETYLYFFLFSVSVFLNIKNKKNIFIFLLSLVLSSFFVSVYATIQALGYDPLNWIESTEIRAISTLGQTNYLGIFIILVLPLNIYFFKKINNSLKYFFVLNFIFSFLALGFSYSLSALIGFFAGLFFAVIFLFYKHRLKVFNKKNIIYFAFFLVLLLASLYFVSTKSYVFQAKINSLFDFSSGSTAARISYWQAGIKGIKERPFFGYGLDTQGEILPKFYETDWGIHSNVGVIPDRAHNIILDALLQVGFFGLITYILFIYVFVKIIFSNIKKGKESFLNYVIFTSLASYFITLLLNFTFIASEVVFWFYFAIVFKIYIDNFSQDKEESSKRGKATLIINLFFLIFIVFCVYWLINNATKEIIADKYYLDIRQARLDNDYFKALILYDYIRDLEPTNNYYDVEFGKMLFSWTPEIEQYGKIYNVKGSLYMSEIYNRLSGRTYNEKYVKANILSVLSRDDKKYSEKAEEELIKLTKEYPGLPRNYYNLANYYFKNKRYGEAEDELDKALNRIPQIDNINLNSDHLLKVKQERFVNLLLMGDVYFERGEAGKAIEHYKEAIALIDEPTINNKLAKASKTFGDINLAIWYNKRAVELDGGNYIWHYYLAKDLFEKNDFEQALDEVNRALELFPYHTESVALKKKIEESWKK